MSRPFHTTGDWDIDMLKKGLILVLVMGLLSGCSVVKTVFFLEPDPPPVTTQTELITQDATDSRPFIQGTMMIPGSVPGLSQGLVSSGMINALVPLSAAQICLEDALSENPLSDVECVVSDQQGNYRLFVPDLTAVDGSLVTGFKQVGNTVQMVSAMVDTSQTEINADPKTTTAVSMALDLIKTLNVSGMSAEKRREVIGSLKGYTTHLMTTFQTSTDIDFESFTSFSWSDQRPFSRTGLKAIQKSSPHATKVAQLAPNLDASTQTLTTVMRRDIVDKATPVATEVRQIQGKVAFPNTTDYTNTTVCLSNLITQKRESAYCTTVDENGHYELTIPDTPESVLLVATSPAENDVKVSAGIIYNTDEPLNLDSKSTFATSKVIDVINQNADYIQNEFIMVNPDATSALIKTSESYYSEIVNTIESQAIQLDPAFTTIPVPADASIDLFSKDVARLFKTQQVTTPQPIQGSDTQISQIENDPTLTEMKQQIETQGEVVKASSAFQTDSGHVFGADAIESSLLTFGTYLFELNDQLTPAYTDIPYENAILNADGNQIRITVPNPPQGLSWVHDLDTFDLVLWGTPETVETHVLHLKFTDLSTGATIEKIVYLDIKEGTTKNKPPKSIAISPQQALVEEGDVDSRRTVGDIMVVDDAFGDNQLQIIGEYADWFGINTNDQTVYLKPGIKLDYESLPRIQIEFKVSDDLYLAEEFIVTTAFTLIITNVNEPPVITDTVSEWRINQGDPFTHQFNISDPDEAASITTTIRGELPHGVGFDGTTHTLSGQPTQAGIYPITLVATDGHNTISQPLELIVFPTQFTNRTAVAHQLDTPKSMMISPSDASIWIVNNGMTNATIHKMATIESSITEIGSTAFRINDMVWGDASTVYIASFEDGNIYKTSVSPWQSTQWVLPGGGAKQRLSRHDQYVLIAQQETCFIQYIDINKGAYDVLAGNKSSCSSSGNDGLGASAKFSSLINDIEIQPPGNWAWVAELDRIRKVTIPGGVVSTMKTDVPLKYASLAADVNRLFGAVNTDGGAMVYQLMYRLDTLIPVMVIDGLDDTIVDMAISGNTLFILGKTQLYRVDIE